LAFLLCLLKDHRDWTDDDSDIVFVVGFCPPLMNIHHPVPFCDFLALWWMPKVSALSSGFAVD
jgi:hypothetical protein